MSHIPGWANIPSAANSTETAATSFAGTYENIPAPWGLMRCYSSDQDGTVTIQISNNGTTAHTTFTRTITAGSTDFFPFLKGDAFVKVSWSSSVAPTALSLKTSYGHYDQGVSPIGNTIGAQAVAATVKAVISGVGDTNAKVTDHEALQVTFPPEGKSGFNELLTANAESVVQLMFPYGINPHLIDSHENGGTVSTDNSMLVIQTGAGANQYARALSHSKVKYEPGLGIRARFTSLFTTGVANSTQVIGIGDSTECFGFGYNGTSFGIVRRHSGKNEIRTLTITTASSTAENITITLDGDADATVAVTNSANTTTTANEIAAHDFSALGSGWTARASGSTVVFISRDSASHAGTFSLSGATTAAGTFAQNLAGAAPTESWVPQASWNGPDIMDGSGVTGVTIDPTKGNVYQIVFQYLGFGSIKYFIEDPDDGEFHLAHTIEYANNNTSPSLDNPSMPMFAEVVNAANTSNIVLKSGSMAAFVDGARRSAGVNRGIKATAVIAASGETPITSIRIAEVFSSSENRTEVKLNYVSCAVEHTKPVAFNFYSNATLTDASFSAIDANNSVVYQDTSATALTGGTFLFSQPLGKTGNIIIDLKDLLDIAKFGPGDVLTIAAEFSSGTNAEVRTSLNFTELF